MSKRHDPEWVDCPSCGKRAVQKGLLGGACQNCGKTERDRAMERQGYDRWGKPLPGKAQR